MEKERLGEILWLQSTVWAKTQRWKSTFKSRYSKWPDVTRGLDPYQRGAGIGAGGEGREAGESVKGGNMWGLAYQIKEPGPHPKSYGRQRREWLHSVSQRSFQGLMWSSRLEVQDLWRVQYGLGQQGMERKVSHLLRIEASVCRILNTPMNMCIIPHRVSLIRNPNPSQFHNPPNPKTWGRPWIPKKEAEMHSTSAWLYFFLFNIILSDSTLFCWLSGSSNLAFLV